MRERGVGSREWATLGPTPHAALESCDFQVLIDRQDLPALEDWQRELLALIQQADTILSIVSPHFVASKMCVREVEQARLLAKRIAPVMIAPVKSDMLPTDVAQIQWLDFSDESLFTRRAEELVRALNSDMDWLKEHTRFAELARRWVQRRRPQEALLRGRELQLAVDWLFSGRARPR